MAMPVVAREQLNGPPGQQPVQLCLLSSLQLHLHHLPEHHFRLALGRILTGLLPLVGLPQLPQVLQLKFEGEVVDELHNVRIDYLVDEVGSVQG